MRNHFLKLTDFLGLKKSIVGLLSMVILIGMGERMAERFLPIYIISLGGGACLGFLERYGLEFSGRIFHTSRSLPVRQAINF